MKTLFNVRRCGITKQGENLTSVRVRDKISLDLPVHAMVQSPKIFLQRFTALEIQEFFVAEPGSYNLQTAVQILQ